MASKKKVKVTKAPRATKASRETRAAQVLELLKKGDLTLAEIATKLGIPRNAAHGCTRRMVEAGTLKKHKVKGESQRFSLAA